MSKKRLLSQTATPLSPQKAAKTADPGGLGSERSDIAPTIASTFHWSAITVMSALSLCSGTAWAQTDTSAAVEDEDVFELSPFTVEGSDQDGYRASHTLAGTRIKTELRDVGAAISVVTEQFMQDIGAKDNETLLSYTLNTEVGGGRGTYGGFGNGAYLSEDGTFTNPNSNTRVRGLTSADNTRNYFITDIPWDGYIVDRVDMVRGPNAVLFGLGSPAGVVNAGIAEANFNNSGNVELNFGSWGSTRLSMKLNRVLIEDELAVKVAMLKDNEKFRQDPAYDNDERIFFAAKYAPKFLQSESSNLTLQGHFESGKIRSNRPRWMPPTDQITPFFNPRLAPGTDPADRVFNPLGGMDRTLLHPWGVQDPKGEYILGGSGPGYLGENSKTYENDDEEQVDNPNWMPVIGNFGNVWGNPVMVFGDVNSSGINRVFQTSVDARYSINEDGEIDTSKGVSYPYTTLHAVSSYDGYARTVELPFYDQGVYKSKTLADTSVFDFRNHMIDGPNKWEESEFDTLYLSLSHTFMDGRFGYDLSYFNQNRHEFRTGSVSPTLQIDVNSHLQDLSVNPNAGRPFVESIYDWGTGFGEQKRDSMRATAFARHDFQANGQDGWLPRLLGRHTVTGLWVEENSETDSRNPVTYFIDGAYRNYANPQNAQRGTPSLRVVHYLGDPIHMRESAAGANIPGIKAVHLPPSQANVYMFDSHWNASGVDPAAPWTNPWTGDESAQAYNPGNYVGWGNVPMNITETTGSAAEDDWISSANLARSEIESEALVWQGHFWDGSVVGTYGWRKDTPMTKSFGAKRTYRQDAGGVWVEDGFVNVSPNTINYGEPVDGVYPASAPGYNLDFESEAISGQTQTASLAVHVNQLIGDRLPFNLSLYYNTSENFQPLAGRVDLFGNAIPSPSGNTEDYSMLIATKDNKYSLKVTQYQTELKDSNLTGGITPWKINFLITDVGTQWAKKAHFNLSGDIWSEEYIKGDAVNWWEDAGWNYHGPWVDGVDQGPEIEKAAIADWFAMLDNLPEGYAEAWSFSNHDLALSKPSARVPDGLSYTEDSVSKGTEFEFIAQPTDQLRIAFNARRSEASRSNIGGDAMEEFVAFLDEWLLEEFDADGNKIYNAGDVRRYWLAEGFEVRADYFNFRYEYGLAKLLEGQSNPEFAKWNFNAVATYNFTDGFLGGFYVGGGYRWTDKKVIGYPLKNVEDATGGQLAVTDLENPYYSDPEDAVDVWFGRSMKLNDKIDWRIQVNIRDLFQDGELIPLTVQPNGDPAASRIPGSTEWTVSNSFSF